MANRAAQRKKVNLKGITPKEEVIRKIGAKLKDTRKSQGFSSYEHVAYELEISRALMGKYENGADMKISTLIKIIQGLGIKVSDFFSDFD
jgi:transcriptional regulator with XRE-family HTH domain